MATLRGVWQLYKENGSESAVHRTVQTKLGTERDGPAVRAFLSELDELLGDADVLLLILSAGLGGAFESTASFLGLLLREDVLQPRLVDALLEKVLAVRASRCVG